MSSGPTLLFQGDSVTNAFRRPEEINESFAIGNGYVFLLAAHIRFAYPRMLLEFRNAGVSGDAVEDLAERWDADMEEARPDVLSLLIGVNDVLRHFSGEGGRYAKPEGYEEMLRGCLQRSLERSPNLKIVLMDPFLLPVGRLADEKRDYIKDYQAAVRRLAEEFGAVHVPLQSLFDEATARAEAAVWAYDGIHPCPGGAQLIANAWMKFVPESFWKG